MNQEIYALNINSCQHHKQRHDVPPESDQASGSSCQFVGNMEGRGNVELHHECAIGKVQITGTSASQVPWVIQQINWLCLMLAHIYSTAK